MHTRTSLLAILLVGLVASGAALGQVPGSGKAQPAGTPPAPPPVTEIDGRTISLWLADLKSPDASVRERAIMVLPQLSTAHNNSEVVKALIDRFNDPDAGPRTKAIMALGMLEIRPDDV